MKLWARALTLNKIVSAMVGGNAVAVNATEERLWCCQHYDTTRSNLKSTLWRFDQPFRQPRTTTVLLRTFVCVFYSRGRLSIRRTPLCYCCGSSCGLR